MNRTIRWTGWRSLAGPCVAMWLGLAALGASAQGAAPAQPAVAGVQSANIFQVAPGAATDPNYAQQTNAERAKVQPGNNAPMWRAVGQGSTGVTNFPYAEYGTLIQPFVQYPGSRLTNAGEAWRQVRNHWANAIAFVCLAVSGIVMAFGKFFLLPVIGTHLFGWLTYALKNLHNFTGPLFAVSLVVVILTIVRDNLPSKEDITWLLKAGGLFGGAEVPSHRFNAGEKVLFWGGVFLFGLIVVASGLVLDKLVPGLAYFRSDMQIAHMIHAAAAVVMMAMFMGHIYMGTVGMSGAYQAMKTGYVDETWAKEHHELWYDDIKAGKIPAQRSAAAAGTAGQTAQA